MAWLISREPGVRGHDQDDLPEVRLSARVVGERRVVHDLQEDAHQVRVRLLDLVEEHDRVGVLAHPVHQQPALLEADVARRRADEPRDRVLLAVLAHVVALELVAEVLRELLGELRLADAGRAGEEERPGRPLGRPEPGPRALDGRGHLVHRLVLPEHHALERFAERAQALPVGRGGLGLGDARHPGDDPLDLRDVHHPPSVLGRVEPKRRPRFVDHVDRAVRQPQVAQVPPGEARRHLERPVRVGDLVVLLVPLAQALEDADRVALVRLVNVDALHAARERTVPLDVLELLERGGAHEPDLALGEDRLDQVGEVHRAAGGRPGAHHRVHLVDEEDRQGPLLERLDDRLEALLEVAAVARAREEGAGVEGEDLRALQGLRAPILEQLLGEPLDDRGLADPGLSHEDGVVLAPPAQHLEGPTHLLHAPDHRVELARRAPAR